MALPGSISTFPDTDPDPDPTKWYGSDRIRIRNTVPHKPSNVTNYNAYHILRFLSLFYLENQVMLLTEVHTISFDFFFYSSNPVKLLDVMQPFPMVCFSFLPRKPSNVTNCNAYHSLGFVFLFYPANQVTLLTVMHIVSYNFFFFFIWKTK